MRYIIGEGKPDVDKNGEFNLVWYANKYYDHLKRNWHVVLTDYVRKYNTIIIPAMEKTDFGLGSFARMENDDVEQILMQIRRDKGFCCADSTINDMRYLIWCVYKEGFLNGHYADKLKYEELGIFGRMSKSEKTKLTAKMMLMKKSLTIDEEFKAAKWFKEKLQNPSEAMGECYGLLLMFVYGLRNAESCGLSFGDITAVPGKEFSCIYIKTTTESSTNELKAGGKTLSAPRVLPMMDFLEPIINDRRAVVLDSLINEGFSIKEAEERIRNIPIVCRGQCYKERASRDDLTENGRSFLREILGEEEYLIRNQATGQALFRQKLKDVSVDEKDATTYLLRRNAATNYYGMGFSAGQIQFMMGHIVENPDDMRSFYVNPDRQEEIKKLFDTHPISVYFGKDELPEQLIINHHGKRKVGIEAISKEPGVGISARIDVPISCVKPKVLVSEGFLPESPNTVDLRYKLMEIAKEVVQKGQ